MTSRFAAPARQPCAGRRCVAPSPLSATVLADQPRVAAEPPAAAAVTDRRGRASRRSARRSRGRPASRRATRRVPLLLSVMALVAVLTGCGQDGLTKYGGFTFVSPDGSSELTYPEQERRPIGQLSGPDLLSDQTLALSDFPDTVIVLNVWGSWCGPCRAEVGDLNRAADATAGPDVQFLGINVKDNRSAAADFHRNKQVPYPSIFDPGMRTLLAIKGYPTSSIPSTIVLDRQHRVAAIYLRVVTETELTATVNALRVDAAPSDEGTQS
jgi:thiol-disulfide isomerase/thioredoxin